MFGICACAGDHVSLGFPVVGIFWHVLGMGFVSRHLTSTASCCFSIMFLSFSLFHLEGYWIRSNNQPVSDMLRHFESQQCSIFGGLKTIFYDTRAHVA